MVREFKLINEKGQEFSLMDIYNHTLLTEPSGLGYTYITEYQQLGDTFISNLRNIQQGQISGTLNFINYENYTEEYFAEHTLAIVSTPVTNNAFDAPAYIDSELRGDTLTVIMEKRYGRGAIEGGDPAIANSFIELPRTDAGKIALEVRPDYYELLCESDRL